MHVLTLTVEEAVNYYDTYNARAIRPITMWLWTINGFEEDYADWDTYAIAQDIKPLTREQLDTLELSQYQEIRVDAAVWVQLMPSPKDASNVGIFSHQMYDAENDPYPSGYEPQHPYVSTLMLYVNERAHIERLVDGLEYAADKLFPKVVD